MLKPIPYKIILASNSPRRRELLAGLGLDNIERIKDLGFGGAVILGDIWNRFSIHATDDFKDLIQHFRRLRRAAE